MSQLSQRFGFNLSNPLPGHIKLFPDFFQGVVGVHINAETHAQHLGLPCG